MGRVQDNTAENCCNRSLSNGSSLEPGRSEEVEEQNRDENSGLQLGAGR